MTRLQGKPSDWFSWLAGTDDTKWKDATLILGGLESNDPVDIQALSVGLKSGHKDVAFWTVVGLGRLGHRAAECLPELIEIVTQHERFGLRQAAVMAITKINPEDARTKRALLRALSDESPFVRREAVHALIKVRPLSSLDLQRIRALKEDPDDAVARWAGIALVNIQRATGLAI